MTKTVALGFLAMAAASVVISQSPTSGQQAPVERPQESSAANQLKRSRDLLEKQYSKLQAEKAEDNARKAAKNMSDQELSNRVSDLQAQSRLNYARQLLSRLVEEHPDTPAAARAKRALEAIEINVEEAR